MDIRQMIMEEHSKSQTKKIIQWIGNSQKRFDILFKLFLNDEYRVVQRAAWPLSYCVIEHPQFIKNHFSKLISKLSHKDIHPAVKRNIIRILQFIELPKKYHGEIMNICFEYLTSNTEPVAIKAFSLTVLERLCQQYPEIRSEIKLIVEERWQYETAAFHVRAKKFLS